MSQEDYHQAATAALSHWDIDVKDLRFVSVSENITFRVEDRMGKAYALRLHRPGYHTLEELESEQLWTRALCDAGVDAPMPVMTRHGTGYAPVAVGEETRYAGILEWVEGIPLDQVMRDKADADFTRRAYERLGEIMAAIHDQATAWTIPDGFARHAFDADGFTGEQPFWGRFWESHFLTTEERARFSDIRARVDDILRALPKNEDIYSLIHADIHPANIIINGERLHVIDFDDSGFGFHAYDFAAATEKEGPALEAMLDGYRRIRDPGNQADLAPFFILIRGLAYLGWLTERPEHLDARPTRLIEFIKESAEDLIGRTEAIPRLEQLKKQV